MNNLKLAYKSNEETPSHALERQLSFAGGEPVSKVSRLAALLNSKPFEIVVFGAIILTVIMCSIETDIVAAGEEIPLWITIMYDVFLVVFSIESALRIFVQRWDFLKDALNIVDVLCITLDIVFRLGVLFVGGMPSPVVMRISRFGRVCRSSRVLEVFPQLKLMLKCVVGTMQTLFWAAVMITFATLLWSILAVQIIHPINKEIAESGTYDNIGCVRCARAYSSVSATALTFSQQVLAGDSWGQITIQVIEHSPWTAIFFAMVFVSLEVALMNLVLASIVDVANQARDDEIKMREQEIADARRAAKEHLINLCKEIDEDGSGELTFDEFANACQSHADFKKTLHSLDVKEEDLKVVWAILDSDGSGDVNYQEFADKLLEMKSSDTHTIMIFVEHTLNDLVKTMKEEFASTLRDLLKTEKDQMAMVKEEEEKIDQLMLQASTSRSKNELQDAASPNLGAPSAPTPSAPESPGAPTPLLGEREEKYTVPGNRNLDEELLAAMKGIERQLEGHFQMLTSYMSAQVLPVPHQPVFVKDTWAPSSSCCSLQKARPDSVSVPSGSTTATPIALVPITPAPVAERKLDDKLLHNSSLSAQASSLMVQPKFGNEAQRQR